MTELANSTPIVLPGEHYLQFLDRLHQQLKPKAYLEIGTQSGNSLALARCPSIAIDPTFIITKPEIIITKPICALYQMTSDQFFEAINPNAVLNRKIDLAFLDGEHLCEFLLRDFLRTEMYCDTKSIVALHDCLPVSEAMAQRKRTTLIWTGDVWRCALVLKRRRSDLRIIALDAPPSGLILITKLDTSAKNARSYYESLAKEMMDLDLASLTVEGLHAEMQVRPTASFDLAQFTA